MTVTDRCQDCSGRGKREGWPVTPERFKCPTCNGKGRLGVTETTLPLMIQPATEKALRIAGRKVVEWTAERDRLIKLAVKEGGSLREVGALAGISHTAVKFIAHGRPSP